jgi:phosphate transport system ATP-binding protein
VVCDRCRLEGGDPWQTPVALRVTKCDLIPEKKVTAFIGPSGCGKSTPLRCLNRMNDLLDHACITAGVIKIEGVDINAPEVDVIELRKTGGNGIPEIEPLPECSKPHVVRK